MPKINKNAKNSQNAKNAQFSRAFQLPARVSRPERPKGAKDEVGPPTRSHGPEGPQTSIPYIYLLLFNRIIITSTCVHLVELNEKKFTIDWNVEWMALFS